MNIASSSVLITGANRGIGRALLEAALDRGAARVYAGARNPGQLADLVARFGDRVVPLAIDVTSEASIAAAAARVPSLDLLINNAGLLASASVLGSSIADLGRDMATNYFGTLGEVVETVQGTEQRGLT